MQLGGPCIERDANLSAEAYELVDCTLLCRAHVRGCDHADAPASRIDVRERLAEMAHARPDHEGADEIHGVGRREFRTQLGADVGLPLAIDEQIALTERRGRRRGKRYDVSHRPATGA